MVLIAVSLVVMSYLGALPPAKYIAAELLFVQNYLGGIWNHTWSLAIEEHFYIGVALLFTWMTSAKPDHRFRFIPRLFAIVATICLLLRVLNLLLFPEYSHQVYLYGTHIRIDSLLFGVLLSYLYHFHDLEQRISHVPSWLLIVVGCLLLSPAFVFALQDYKWITVFGVMLFYMGGGAFLLACLRLKESSIRVLRLPGSLGAASYSIYLWHMPVNQWGYLLVNKNLHVDSYVIYTLTYLAGSCLFGWIISRVLEYPVLYIRDNLFPQAISADTAKQA